MIYKAELLEVNSMFEVLQMITMFTFDKATNKFKLLTYTLCTLINMTDIQVLYSMELCVYIILM